MQASLFMRTSPGNAGPSRPAPWDDSGAKDRSGHWGIGRGCGRHILQGTQARQPRASRPPHGPVLRIETRGRTGPTWDLHPRQTALIRRLFAHSRLWNGLGANKAPEISIYAIYPETRHLRSRCQRFGGRPYWDMVE